MAARDSSQKRAGVRTTAAASASRRPARVVPLRGSNATLMCATPVGFDEAARVVHVRVGGAELPARMAQALSPAVVRTAIERGEMLVVTEDAGMVVLGALRMAPTPGVDEGEEYVIAAKRIELRAADRVAIVAGAAQVLVSAIDRVEVLASDITSRARRVHRLVGRMLHLN